MHARDISRLAGQLIIGGFDGAELPERYARALREGLRGGAILFRRNLPEIASAARLNAAIVAACPADLPPFIGVDQEGGRVVRLPAPFLTLPPMRALGRAAARGDGGDLSLVRRAAEALGRELAAVGVNLAFAPVLDVDSNPDNPVIGDRSFGADPDLVAACAVAFLEGIGASGVLACGKHFPGHGDTSVDSHVDLPRIAHDRARLERVELVPFRAAIAAGIDAMMTAHVVVSALDPAAPATLAFASSTDLLRRALGFSGVLFSDDMEMGAIAARFPPGEAAVAAVRAGCDALLVCKSEEAQELSHEALARQVERDPAFRARCEEALARGLAARRRARPRPITERDALLRVVGSDEGKAVRAAILGAAEAAGAEAAARSTAARSDEVTMVDPTSRDPAARAAKKERA
jgi:beta-N-acetylhexosaminidase